MTTDAIRLLAAVLFLLIAVVGGGFTIKELSIPKVPNAARIAAGLLGVLFAVPFVLGQTGPDATTDRRSPVRLAAAGSSEGAPDRGPFVLWDEDQPDTTADGVRLLELEATSPSAEPAVGDRITIAFSLENVGGTPLELASTFIGARSPDDAWRDFGEGNQARTLEPGASLTVRSSIIPNEPGTWRFWPCYTLMRGGEERFCPDEWRVFPVEVRP
jgi:hypothetical protein